jgi:hypothetical protein
MAAVPVSDCVAIITNHSVYDYATILKAAENSAVGTVIVDTRNALGQAGKESAKVIRL